MATWLEKWEPEEPQFWKETGSKIAWRTLTITTLCLIFSFATWFTMSIVAPRLPDIGFKFTPLQLFWIVAAAGIASGTGRIIYTFFIPIFGTRHVITVTTLIKVIPCLALALAIINPGTPFWVFFTISFFMGFMGGGDFSSYMPSTSMFFPRRLQGTALGIQAGIGNFGVSLTQFAVPWIIGFALAGTILGGSKIVKPFKVWYGTELSEIWLQNAGWIWIPFLLVLGPVAWKGLRSIPIRASLRQQMDIFTGQHGKHTFICTWTYCTTFGTFSGQSAAFPLMIYVLYGQRFPEARIDPMVYAFLGPLVGSLIRVVAGFPSDKIGGSIVTQFAQIGIIAASLGLIFGGYLNPTSADQFTGFVILILTIFLCAGIGNASTFRQYPIIFAYNRRMGAGVVAFTAAVAAYGPFVHSALIGQSISRTGGAELFYWFWIGFMTVGALLNLWYYTIPGKHRWDWGTSTGWKTWWDDPTAKEREMSRINTISSNQKQ